MRTVLFNQANYVKSLKTAKNLGKFLDCFIYLLTWGIPRDENGNVIETDDRVQINFGTEIDITTRKESIVMGASYYKDNKRFFYIQAIEEKNGEFSTHS